jgi:hypothetical protein
VFSLCCLENFLELLSIINPLFIDIILFGFIFDPSSYFLTFETF